MKPIVIDAGLIQVLQVGDNTRGTLFPAWDDDTVDRTTKAIPAQAEHGYPIFGRYLDTFGTLSDQWLGGVLAPSGMIYGIPHDAESLLKINPSNDTVSTSGTLSSDIGKWAGGV
ncbi:hypothetical protein LCGC14_2395230, partial [marine sediment metagenome]